MPFLDLALETPTARPTPIPKVGESGDTWLILISCVLSGIVLGGDYIVLPVA
jgi:hypothetical protein